MNTKFDVDRARIETPGCQQVIHLNNAGASLMPNCVLHAVNQHLKLESEIGGYEAADYAFDKIELVYDAVAKLLNCQSDEIAIIENATRAWDMAFYSIPFSEGDRILTSVSEYASNFIAYLQISKKTGAKVDIIPNDEYGQISVPSLSQMIDKKVKLIAITHIPTNGGLVNPAVEIGKIARDAKVPYLLDACQSVGQMPIDVQEIGCDMLSATGRKYLRGPRGTGFLFIREEMIEKLEPPFLDIHAATWIKKDQYKIQKNARRFENWEAYVAGKIGLATAVNYALDWGIENIWQRISQLVSKLRSCLQDIPNVTLHDLGQVQCGIVSFTVAGVDSTLIVQKLRDQKINVSVSSRASTLLDMEARHLNHLIRASVHYFNTEKEIEQFMYKLAQIIG